MNEDGNDSRTMRPEAVKCMTADSIPIYFALAYILQFIYHELKIESCSAERGIISPREKFLLDVKKFSVPLPMRGHHYYLTRVPKTLGYSHWALIRRTVIKVLWFL